MDLVPDLSFCIVARQGPEQLRAILQALYDTAGQIMFEVFVVDCGTGPGLAGMLGRHFPAVHLFDNPGQPSWAEASNLALRLARGRYLALWDDDLLCHPGCLHALLGFLDDTPEVGLAGPRIVDAVGRPEATMRRFPTLLSLLATVPAIGRDWPGQRWRDRHRYADRDLTVNVEVDWLQGAALFMRAEMLEEIGLLEEAYGDRYADMDLCWRARRAGWHVHSLAQAVAERLPGAGPVLPVPLAPPPWPALARFFWKKL
ncbi:MAG: hypothetical protein COZ12_03540 [Deltaproteobacteria bacterium CG_4_10_14_3_um_filter_60_8]|nr:MAG: hypothetical protein AUK28_06385 [Desulfobacterales bacterium CG2_30_60_27]PIP43879.1 MAG: hypothetical protein COX17_04560 [Deltaproteobacteria bacterium CG23_combo_of_CG06-09_8_20_14_all_60_8]PIY22124.1 MAG: hypothetical protein COZ12_03540 [Deltaproteobacteria bacterium CG_4_10_14_3_um_filter_60_8]